MSTHTRTIPEWLTDDRVGTIVSPPEAAELPIGALVVRDQTEVYRVGPRGGMRLPLSNDPAARRIDLFDLALDGALKVVSVDGRPITPYTLDELPYGAIVEDSDGDLWTAADVDGKRGWVYTYDRSARRVVEGSGRPCSSTALVMMFGPITGTDLVPDSCTAPTPVGGLYPTPADETVRADSDRFDDPDTADNSLDLDDLYRAPVDTVVVDSDGDLWRRQVTDDGARAWVLVGGQPGQPFSASGPAIAAPSERLRRLYGPIAYAPAEDVKAALVLIPRDVEGVLGDPEPAPTDSSLDPDDADAVVEYALNRARVALTGDGEHVAVAIARDRDGRVTVRTEVTEQVGGQL